MKVSELKAAVDGALEAGLHPDTAVVIAINGWYALVDDDPEHPKDGKEGADMWFTLTPSASEDGNRGPGGEGDEYAWADARFTPGHEEVPDPQLYQNYLEYKEEFCDPESALYDPDAGRPPWYHEWLADQVQTYEQIWRESARDRDRGSCEEYLVRLRPELERMS